MAGYDKRRNLNESGDLVIDYKDAVMLKRFISETGKIIPSRLNGMNASQQRKLARAIKQARYMALLPYTDQHI